MVLPKVAQPQTKPVIKYEVGTFPGMMVGASSSWSCIFCLPHLAAKVTASTLPPALYSKVLPSVCFSSCIGTTVCFACVTNSTVARRRMLKVLHGQERARCRFVWKKLECSGCLFFRRWKASCIFNTRARSCVPDCQFCPIIYFLIIIQIAIHVWPAVPSKIWKQNISMCSSDVGTSLALSQQNWEKSCEVVFFFVCIPGLPSQESTWRCAGRWRMAKPGKINPSRYGQGRVATPVWHRWTGTLRKRGSSYLSSTRRVTGTTTRLSPLLKFTCMVAGRGQQRWGKQDCKDLTKKTVFMSVQINMSSLVS